MKLTTYIFNDVSTFIENFTVFGSQLSGTIPTQLGALTNLRKFAHFIHHITRVYALRVHIYPDNILLFKFNILILMQQKALK
jgi:hypothetical protein